MEQRPRRLCPGPEGSAARRRGRTTAGYYEEDTPHLKRGNAYRIGPGPCGLPRIHLLRLSEKDASDAPSVDLGGIRRPKWSESRSLAAHRATPWARPRLFGQFL